MQSSTNCLATALASPERHVAVAQCRLSRPTCKSDKHETPALSKPRGSEWRAALRSGAGSRANTFAPLAQSHTPLARTHGSTPYSQRRHLQRPRAQRRPRHLPTLGEAEASAKRARGRARRGAGVRDSAWARAQYHDTHFKINRLEQRFINAVLAKARTGDAISALVM